jgi:hypothetical protein
MMRGLKMAAAAAMTFAFSAVPAFGAVIINSADTGYSFTVDYTGIVGLVTTPSVSAVGTYTFTGLSNNGLTYNFNYSLANTSTTDARLSGFAFNTTPNPINAAVSGSFTQAYATGGTYPESYGQVDFCFTDAGGSCAGGGNAGYFENNTGTGTFAVTFANVMSSISFDDFVTRFQSISGVQSGNSGIGTGVLAGGAGDPITAPEPASWMMMLGGFGLVGWAARRRRTGEQASALQLA